MVRNFNMLQMTFDQFKSTRAPWIYFAAMSAKRSSSLKPLRSYKSRNSSIRCCISTLLLPILHPRLVSQPQQRSRSGSRLACHPVVNHNVFFNRRRSGTSDPVGDKCAGLGCRSALRASRRPWRSPSGWQSERGRAELSAQPASRAE